jgi:ABC-type multidrug transport system fused ATPase/permease subunit
LSAISRIKPFLERETREPTEKSALSAEDNEPLLSLRNAGFEIPSISNNTGLGSLHLSLKDGGGSFSVGRVESHVKRGEVLCVCGPVGSGKTTFVSGILDELPAMVGSEMTIRGKVAFVPQTPFILNATLRENILFGAPYDPQIYEKVLDVCNLRHDIEQLGEAGDMTEIGERGVTLSGGT